MEAITDLLLGTPAQSHLGHTVLPQKEPALLEGGSDVADERCPHVVVGEYKDCGK